MRLFSILCAFVLGSLLMLHPTVSQAEAANSPSAKLLVQVAPKSQPDPLKAAKPPVVKPKVVKPKAAKPKIPAKFTGCGGDAQQFCHRCARYFYQNTGFGEGCQFCRKCGGDCGNNQC